MNTEIIVRMAINLDVKDIIKLNNIVQKMHAEQYPNLFKYPIDKYELQKLFEEIMNKDNDYILVAEKATGGIVGYAWIEIIERPENPFMYARNMVYVHQIGVEEKEQNKGIGQMLLSKAEDLAREYSADRLTLDSWVFNQKAHGAFEKFGFEKCKSMFWKDVSK